MKTVSIVGFGLLGASLGMALRGKQYGRMVWARRPEVRKWALEHDAADCAADTPEEAFSRADLVVLCLPIPEIIRFIRTFSRFLKPGALLTDIGSVKGEVEEAALSVPGLNFIGSHPMAGTEKNGPENAFPTLYENADAFVVPHEGTSRSDLDFLLGFWKDVGMKCTVINSREHDELVASTSHVPHLLASALALSVLDEDDPRRKQLRFCGCATGFRDTSRVASSSARMWREIIEHNTPAVLENIRHFRRYFDEFERQIASGDFDAFEKLFAKGGELRGEWLNYKKY